jgi:hypothetical protein
MSKRSSHRSPEWLRHQAEVRIAAQAKKKELGAERQEVEAQEKLKELLTALVKRAAEQQGRTTRLAEAFAERCMRVRELKEELRVEWERAQEAEAKIKKLQGQLNAAKKTNGHAPEVLPAISA